MTARRHQAELDRHRAELRQETLQQRQQAAVDAAREADDERAAVAARVAELRDLRLARDASRTASQAAAKAANE
ncbi:hypothetical protein [Ferrovibrio sp.]|jgi:hypothetical protein|uniref:hypothetical protein n=1 Tax=Ferrovibrio sp. TaxID=1917215 RepID=UPI000CB48B98|nr:hypothetical protein [Ferrovibrio sp.]PJI39589.1 MAG: hypothetical protein CTR53_12260 [Ferrovibrio sp.]